MRRRLDSWELPVVFRVRFFWLGCIGRMSCEKFPTSCRLLECFVWGHRVAPASSGVSPRSTLWDNRVADPAPAPLPSPLSNSTSAAKIWKTNLPPLLVVSMASVTLWNPTPCASSFSTVSIKCLSDRPRRSSLHTASVSPGRSDSNGGLRFGIIAGFA